MSPPVFKLVDGGAFARRASILLEEAWDPPSIHYSAEYLEWQLRFPAAFELPTAAAFDGEELIGFAAASGRRIRCSSGCSDVALVSFVAVRRGWRNRGVAAGLYRTLTDALSECSVPVITFASPASTGERTLLRSYERAGFSVQPLGEYSNYARLARDSATSSDYEAVITGDLCQLRPVVDACSSDPTVLWSDPSDAQLEHYRTDPRGRRFLIVRHSTAGLVAAAWVIRMEIRTLTGSTVLRALDCVWMRKDHVLALPALCRSAAAAWPNEQDGPGIISAPNLSILDAATLLTLGFRQTGARFRGYFCTPLSSAGIPSLVTRTNFEIA